MFKVFDQIESSQNADSEKPIFLHACYTCSELPSNISTMDACKQAYVLFTVIDGKKHITTLNMHCEYYNNNTNEN